MAEALETAAIAATPEHAPKAPTKYKESALTAAVESWDIPELSAESLIQAGVHYGHSTRNWDPRMKHLIFGKKDGIHIINIKETLRGAVRARYFLNQVASAGVDVLIVGTKKQAADVVRSEAMRCGMPFVATRWLGGTLTNHATIRTRLKRLEEIESMKADGRFDRSAKKSQSRVEREYKKVRFNLEGLRELDKLPAALLVIDAKHEKNAIAEARNLNIPVVAIIDTDSNPEQADIVIPGNDDSLRGIQIILRYICEGIIEGVKLHEAGQGLKNKAGLQTSTYEDMSAGGSRDKKRGGKGGGGDRRRQRPSGPRGPRTEEAAAVVDAAAGEALAQAEAQNKAPKARVRVKPPAMKTGAAKPAAAKASGGDKGAAPAKSE